jgi:mono/diheme cytochrome c family protein
MMKPRDYLAALAAAFFGFSALPVYAACPPGGIYTAAEATAGMADYNNNCASCHNADMSGNAGPALAGPNFASYLSFTKITAPQLQAFIVAQMPATAPGSLTATQYNNIFAYILSYNHYPAGNAEISPAGLSCLSLLPYPGSK